MKPVYFDHIAGTPLHAEVLKAMIPYLKEEFGNPQSFHSVGQKAAQALEQARAQVAQLLNAGEEEIYFTSSGSESNNLAVKGLALANRMKGKHLVLSAIEHQSVLNAAKSLEKLGFHLTLVPVDKWGLVDPGEVKKAITPETVFVSIMLANSEVGTIQPLKKIAEICRAQNTLLHTDAVAAVGNIPVDVKEMDVDVLSLAAHQFYGPRGSGAIFVRKGTRLLPLIDGGIQERGKRAGSENVAGIVGLGAAAEWASSNMAENMKKMKGLRDRLIKELPDCVDHVVLTGHPQIRLPFHASFCIEFVEGEAMLLTLDMQGIAVSSGSACTSKSLQVSHVLLAMGFDHALAQGSLVFSLIDKGTSQDIDYLLKVFPPIIKRLRMMSPLYTEYLEENKE